MTDDVHEIGNGGDAAASPGGSGQQPDAPAADSVAAERDRYYDLLLRKTAEFDNYRKRVERERRELIDLAAADVLAELLPVVDDLERALRVDSAGDQGDAYRKGVELIHRSLLEMLRRRGVTVVETVGHPFDPHRHQAVTYEPAEGKADGEVIEEYARGYVVGDRLLRPAMVKVAKA